MWACVLLTVLVCFAAAAPQKFCPSNCSCALEDAMFTARCSSLDFLSKQTNVKGFADIESVFVNKGPVVSGSKIFKLPNLRAIDLSHNALTDIPNVAKHRFLRSLTLQSNNIHLINTDVLPPLLNTLNLSENNIKSIPESLLDLKYLFTLDISKNPIHCTCDSFEIRDALIKRDVHIVGNVECAAPEKYKKKSWLSLRCDDKVMNKKAEHLYDVMLGDEPMSDEGSGNLGETIEHSEETDSSDRFEPDFIPISVSNEPSLKAVKTTPEPLEDGNEEGSGFTFLGNDQNTFASSEENKSTTDSPTNYSSSTEEGVMYDEIDGSGDGEPTVDGVTMSSFGELEPTCLRPPCIKKAPSDGDEEKDNAENATSTSPIDTLKAGILTIYGDTFGPETTTTNDGHLTVEPEINETVVSRVVPTSQREKALEPLIVKEDVTGLETEKTNDNIVEGTTSQEAEIKQSTSIYIVTGVLLLIVIVLLGYAYVTKRDAKRKYRRHQEMMQEQAKAPGQDVEMKLLSQDEKPKNGTTETSPMFNGRSNIDHPNDDNLDFPRSASNGTEDPIRDSPMDATPYPSIGEQDDMLNYRPSQDSPLEQQSPPAQRVTIKVSELPDSVPKTPILVNRQVSADGRTVNIPNVKNHSD